MARTGSPHSRSRPVTVRPTAPSLPAAPVTRIDPLSDIAAPSLSFTPTVAAENSVRVLPWRSIRLASESRSKPHPHHSLSELPQPISGVVEEHSDIEQTQGAIHAPPKVDYSR